MYCKLVESAYFHGIMLDCWPKWMDIDCGLWMDPWLDCCEVSWGYTTGLSCSLQGAAARRSLTRMHLVAPASQLATRHHTRPAAAAGKWAVLNVDASWLHAACKKATQFYPKELASAGEGEGLNFIELSKSHHLLTFAALIPCIICFFVCRMINGAVVWDILQLATYEEVQPKRQWRALMCSRALRPGQDINAACHKLGFSLNKKHLKRFRRGKCFKIQQQQLWREHGITGLIAWVAKYWIIQASA